MDFLKNHYISVIANQISKNKKEDISNTIEDILENLSYLADKNKNLENEEECQWISLPIKRMLLYIIYDGQALIQTKIINYKENEFAEAETVITLQDHIIAYQTKRICYEDVYPFAQYTPAKRNVLMVEMVKGSCETRAIYKAGIAMEFVGDVIDVTPSTNTPSNPNPPVNIPDDVVNKMHELINSEESPSSFPNDNLKVLFGQSEGVLLKDVSDEYKLYMLAYIEEGIETVPEDYLSKLKDICSPLMEQHKAKYNHYCKMAKAKKANNTNKNS